jgi:FPC/CPF motif-containing protein YcgG
MMMISADLQNWTSRVLDRGKLGTTPEDNWKVDAYEQYKATLRAPDYPCFFGQSAEARGEMLYTFIAECRLDDLVADMRQFVRLIGTPDYERCSLIAFFEPDPSIADHTSFVARFWQVLQCLHEHDRDPEINKTPDHPLWEFSSSEQKCSLLEPHPPIAAAAAGTWVQASFLYSSPDRFSSIRRPHSRSQLPSANGFTSACWPATECRCIPI